MHTIYSSHLEPSSLERLDFHCSFQTTNVVLINIKRASNLLQ